MRARQRSYGQSLVEIAISLPVLVLIIFGMADFARAYSTNVFIRSAVSEGGYYAAQHPDDDDGIRDRIISELGGLQPAITDGDIEIESCVAGDAGPQTEISVTYDYYVLFGKAGSGPKITLRNGIVVPQFGGCQ